MAQAAHFPNDDDGGYWAWAQDYQVLPPCQLCLHATRQEAEQHFYLWARSELTPAMLLEENAFCAVPDCGKPAAEAVASPWLRSRAFFCAEHPSAHWFAEVYRFEPKDDHPLVTAS